MHDICFLYVVDENSSEADIGFLPWHDYYEGERTHSYTHGVM